MISVTAPLRDSHRAFDAQHALIRDLRDNPQDYLNHKDGTVRHLADWTMEYYKLRNLRWDIAAAPDAGRRYLERLYERLHQLSVATTA
jgi:hypothetical protein